MDPTPTSWTDTTASLAQGATLLTLNRRLAETLQARYAEARIAVGETAWEAPDILTFDAWLRRAHAQLVERGVFSACLLSDAEAALLWEDVIGRDPGADLLNHADLARLALEAQQLIEHWRLDRGALADQHKPETRTLLRWLRRFDQHCEQRGWLSTAALANALLLDWPDRVRPQQIIFAGFDSWTPAQQALLAHLADSGTEFGALRIEPARDSAASAHACTDAGDEIEQAARWAGARLRATPSARIGLVVPDLAARRVEVEQTLYQALQPHRLPPGANHHQAVFAGAAPPPLAEQALIADALRLLSLVVGELEFADVSALLRSPFLGGADSEADTRHRLDAELRRHVGPRLRLDQLLHQLTRLNNDLPCPNLLNRLLSAQSRHAEQSGKADPGHWAMHFQHLLQDTGWPGEREADSDTWQLSKRFNELLDQLAGMARVRPRVGVAEALTLLRRLARDERFLAASPRAPIQVIGLLETVGQRFDHLWVMGLTDDVFPAAASPNPLLPTQLQRELDMPHSSAAHEQAYAQRLVRALRESSAEVVFSHSERDADRELRPSPLLDGLPAWPGLDNPTEATGPEPPPLEQLDDWNAPATSGPQPGGSGLFSRQALCPFSALAQFRWGAHALEQVLHAPDNRVTGDLLHDCLHQVWQQLRDQQTLNATGDETLANLIDNAADKALARWRVRRPDLYKDTYTRLERQRLVTLVQRWLRDYESRRASFELESAEQRHQSQFDAGIQINLVADRIDRLPDGRLVVIDYKTGRSAKTKGWYEERVTEPQVPLYCVDLAKDGKAQIAAAALAKLVSLDDATGFEGTAADADLLPEVKPYQQGKDETRPADWNALLAHWRSSLNELAQEIAQGEAAPTPSTEACRYCDLPALCRRDSWQAFNDEAGEP